MKGDGKGTQGQVGSDPRIQDINDFLKEHAITIEDWHHRKLARLLHEWADRFNQEFGLGIPTPAIRIDRIGALTLETYRLGRIGGEGGAGHRPGGDRSSFPRLGEKVQITIRPQKEARSALAYIDLPPMLAAVRFGAQVQRLCLPIEQGALVLETVAIRRGRAHLWVGLADMYDAGLWGSVPGIGVVVF